MVLVSHLRKRNGYGADMTILNSSVFIAIGVLSVASTASANIHITPQLGFTGGGIVKNSNDEKFDIKPSESFAISIESDLQTSRLGLYYSHQSSNVESENLDSTIQYLMFQSSIYYPLANQSFTYLGIGIGGSYINADWSDNHTGFAASLFGGFEYPISDSVSFTSQVRWLGTVVDNNTTTICNLPSSRSTDCRIQFDTDWMNQFTMSAGVVMTF